MKYQLRLSSVLDALLFYMPKQSLTDKFKINFLSNNSRNINGCLKIHLSKDRIYIQVSLI